MRADRGYVDAVYLLVLVLIILLILFLVGALPGRAAVSAGQSEGGFKMAGWSWGKPADDE